MFLALKSLFLFCFISVIGAVLIVLGLYTVVWGKSKDQTSSQPPALTNEKIGNLELPITDTAAKPATKFDDDSIQYETSKIPAKSTLLLA